MSIKKKMGTGILAGALGLSLVGGGTWAAFNDVETTSNTFAAGTLDLVVGNDTTMDFVISNLKPGDYFTKKLVLTNNGSLDINQIKLHALTQPGWENKDIIGLGSKITTEANAGLNTQDDFLKQFKVIITKLGATTTDNVVVYDGRLNALVGTSAIEELTETNDTTVGLASGGTSTYDVYVEFVKDDALFSGTRLHKQNKYQGEMSNLKFVFEATQMPGADRTSND
jgi:spore coat-associated protein N